MKYKRMASVVLIAAALLISEPADAKAFGWETTSQISYISGGCTFILTTETYYFFGIGIDTRSREVLVGCDPTPTPCVPGPCPDGPPYE